MSEYQRYEFQAIDRCLSDVEIRELRNVSTRANITSTSFINEYSWGDFKGDSDLWMEKYFDAFLYYANWGTHTLKLRVPSELLNLEMIQPYCIGSNPVARICNENVIFDFGSDSERGYDDWEDEWELSSFLSLRHDLIRGDFRCLYLGWLSDIQYEEFDENEIEPPVPCGLSELNPALLNLVEFLRIDCDLLDVACKKSLPMEEGTPGLEFIQKWLKTLSIGEKNDVLISVLKNSFLGDYTPAIKLSQSVSKAWGESRCTSEYPQTKPRLVRELLQQAECLSNERER